MRRLLALVFTLLLFGGSVYPQVSFIVAANAGGPTGGTTSAVNTTGANFESMIFCSGSTSLPTVSDSASNSWGPPLASYIGVSNQTLRLYAVTNPTTAANQTFTVSSGGGSYSSFVVLAFSGQSTLDQKNGTFATSSVTSFSPGSITPTMNNELLLTGVCSNSVPSSSYAYSIDSSFTIPTNGWKPYQAGSNYAAGSAYLIQTTATAENPTWSWTGGSSSYVTSMIASFKPLVTGAFAANPDAVAMSP